jgi:ribosomal protein S18 acetylase RimI-like enzyme
METIDIIVRVAQIEDLTSMQALFEIGDAYHRQAHPDIFKAPDNPDQTRGFIASLLTDPASAVFVAQREGRLIGVLYVMEKESSFSPILVKRRYAVIGNVVVHPAARRSGVGQALMEHAYEWAKARQLERVELNVWEFNQGARVLYEKLGYVTASRKMWKKI